jgi:ATP-dependent helicase HrpA
VAKRIAEELNSPLGEVVGYKVRFQDRLQPGASVKLMTDGILLAETQTDPLLRAYDTLIIDEAHERSLNIDFLLGYLRRSCQAAGPEGHRHLGHHRRRALRAALRRAAGPAPVIQVSGGCSRSSSAGGPSRKATRYDLQRRHRRRRRRAVARGRAGDILVFLPGEREIREAADHLRKHLARPAGGAAPVPEILPLFARLSQAEQDRVFEPATAGASCWPPTWPRPRSPCPASAT